MRRKVVLAARASAGIVALLGIYASVQAGRLGAALVRWLADISETELNDAALSIPFLVVFLVTFVFFASLALLLWLAAETSDAVDAVREDVATIRVDQSMLAERLATPSRPSSMAVAAPVLPTNLVAAAPASPPSEAAQSAREPSGDSDRTSSWKECVIEERTGSTRGFRAAVIYPNGGWLLEDQEEYDPQAPWGGRERALQALSDRLVEQGWEPSVQAGNGELPRFRRLVAE